MKRLAVIAVVTAMFAAAGAQAATKPGTFAGTLGVTLPKGAQGEVRAISRADGRIAAARTTGAKGQFTLTLPSGQYLVVGAVIPAGGKGKTITETRVAVSLKPGQKRTKTSLKARKKKKRKSAKASYVQEGGQVTPGNIAVEIPPFTGATGELSVLNRGITNMLISDVASGGDCDVTVVEVEHRRELTSELELSRSPYVDPSSRVTRNFVVGDVQARGRFTNNAAGTGVEYTVRLIDTRSGNEVGQLTGTIDAADFAAGEAQLAKNLKDELCKLTDVYEVAFHLDGSASFPSHTMTSVIDATILAKRATRTRVWTGSGTFGWSGTSVTALTECSITSPVAPTVDWSVTLTTGANGTLRIEWTYNDSDMVTITTTCPTQPPVPVAGGPGVAVLNTEPHTFALPVAGGTQTLSGSIGGFGQGWSNSGQITVTPKGVTRMG